jgi:hypothetical protein
MCIWEGADWYRDMTHHGGILSTFWANWYDMVKTVQYGAGARQAQPRARRAGVRPGDAERGAGGEEPRDFGNEIRNIRSTTTTTRRARRYRGSRRVVLRGELGRQGLHPRGTRGVFARSRSRNGLRRGIEH